MRVLLTKNAWKFWLFVAWFVSLAALQTVVDYDG
jgi:hypothetical protein